MEYINAEVKREIINADSLFGRGQADYKGYVCGKRAKVQRRISDKISERADVYAGNLGE